MASAAPEKWLLDPGLVRGSNRTPTRNAAEYLGLTLPEDSPVGGLFGPDGDHE